MYCMMFIALIDGDVSTLTGSKYLEYNPGSELNILLVKSNNENWIEQNNLMKQKSNKRQTKMNNKSNNNNDITGKRTLFTT